MAVSGLAGPVLTSGRLEASIEIEEPLGFPGGFLNEGAPPKD